MLAKLIFSRTEENLFLGKTVKEIKLLAMITEEI
jgi:hypothetical protein